MDSAILIPISRPAECLIEAAAEIRRAAEAIRPGAARDSIIAAADRAESLIASAIVRTIDAVEN